MDRRSTVPISCVGGLDLSSDTLTQGTKFPGSARVLQNWEPAVEGGYKKIKGYTKFSNTAVTGNTSAPILGCIPAFGGVLAARYESTGSASNSIYFSSGTTWTIVNSADRGGSASKVRFINYSFSAEVVVGCDGVNPAFKYDGSTYTLINGSGAPSAPKYAETILSRLVLAPGSSASSFVMSAPNADTNYNAGDGAIEINVGDTIVGLKNFRETLYIFCKNSIYKLTGNTSSTFLVTPVTKQIGCYSGDTIQEIGGDLLFLAPDGLRSIAATDRIGDVDLALVSGNIHRTISDLIAGYSPDDFSSVVIRKKGQYRLFVNQSTTDQAAAFGIIAKIRSASDQGGYEFSFTSGIKPSCINSRYDTNTEVIVFGDHTNGIIYRLESGDSFDGTTIPYIYTTPQVFFEDPGVRKNLYKITVHAEVSGNANLSLTLLYDFSDDGVVQPTSATLTRTGSYSTYGTAIYGTSSYSVTAFTRLRDTLNGSGLSVAFQFTGDDSDPPVRISAFEVELTYRGRR